MLRQIRVTADEFRQLAHVMSQACDYAGTRAWDEDLYLAAAHARVALYQGLLSRNAYQTVLARREVALALSLVDDLDFAPIEEIHRAEVAYVERRLGPASGRLRQPLTNLSNVIGAQDRLDEARVIDQRIEELPAEDDEPSLATDIPTEVTGTLSDEALDGVIEILAAYAEHRAANCGDDAIEHLEACEAREAVLFLRRRQHSGRPEHEQVLEALSACVRENLAHRGFHFAECMDGAQSLSEELVRLTEAAHGPFAVPVCDALLLCACVEQTRIEVGLPDADACVHCRRRHGELITRVQDILMTNAAQLEDVGKKTESAGLFSRAEAIGRQRLR